MPTPKKTHSRRCAVQALYQWHITGEDLCKIADNFASNGWLDNANQDYFRLILQQIDQQLATIDLALAEFCDRPIAKIDPVATAILRVGAWEMSYRLEIPHKVVINEGINLAKHFGAEGSYKYINSILDKFSKKARPAETDNAPNNDYADLPAEFALVRRYFNKPPQNSEVALGIGDDCALLKVADGEELAVSTDVMVQGVHFSADCDPYQLGHKLLAVNLSDLAAMGARPIAATLAIVMPNIDHKWLEQFTRGLGGLAAKYGVDIIGGDTSRGALTLSMQVLGAVPVGAAMLRLGAKAGDLIGVTACLGDAGLGLKIQQGYSCYAPKTPLRQLHSPEPQIAAGLALRDTVSACIDLSDGIASDLRRILQPAEVGATLDWDKIPLSPAVSRYIQETGDWQLPLTAGEDYQLCFTVSVDAAKSITIPFHTIGVVDSKAGLRISKDGVTQDLKAVGYEHFA